MTKPNTKASATISPRKPPQCQGVSPVLLIGMRKSSSASASLYCLLFHHPGREAAHISSSRQVSGKLRCRSNDSAAGCGRAELADTHFKVRQGHADGSGTNAQRGTSRAAFVGDSVLRVGHQPFQARDWKGSI